MSTEALLFYSTAFAIAAAVAAVLLLIHAHLRPDAVTEKLTERHAGKSPLAPSRLVKAAAVACAVYAVIALTSDPAYTWLASAAMMCFAWALVADRACAHIMVAKADGTFSIPQVPRPKIKIPRRKDDEEEEIVIESGDSDQRREQLEPEPIAPGIINIVFLLADIIAIAAFVDLFVLLGMEIFEFVAPIVAGWLG